MSDILSSVMGAGGFAIKAVSVVYGLVSLGVFVFYGLLDGKLLRQPSEKATRELAAGTILQLLCYYRLKHAC